MAMFGSGLLDLLKAENPAVAHGLLQAGLSLLSSRGKFGNALGGAGMAGIQGAQQFKERQFQRQLQEQQMKQMQRAEQMQALPGKFMRPPSAPAFDATGGMETAVENPNNASGPGGFDEAGYVKAMMGFDPIQAKRFEEMTKKTVPQPFKIGNNERLLEPGTNRVLVDAMPDKADKPTGSVQEYEYARAQGYKGTFEQWDTARKRAGASSVSVNTGQRDSNWGTPPKDYVWARDAAGNVLTERDQATGALRPVALPIGGSKDAKETQQANAAAAAKAKQAYTTISQLMRHPGTPTVLGLSGQIDPRNHIWGTEAQGAKALLEQAQGQAFLQAFESLKGGGQITQVEGEKATAAMARLQRAQNETDFAAAASEIVEITRAAYKRSTNGEELPPVALPKWGGSAKGKLNPAEQAELDQLRKRFKR